MCNKFIIKDIDGCILICWYYIFIVNVKIIVYRFCECYKLRVVEIDFFDLFGFFLLLKRIDYL